MSSMRSGFEVITTSAVFVTKNPHTAKYEDFFR